MRCAPGQSTFGYEPADFSEADGIGAPEPARSRRGSYEAAPLFGQVITIDALRASNIMRSGANVPRDGRMLAEILVSVVDCDRALEQFSRREQQVLRMLAERYTQREIAEEIGMCLRATTLIIQRLRVRLYGDRNADKHQPRAAWMRSAGSFSRRIAVAA